jgi:uncharacterized cofD-like protein
MKGLKAYTDDITGIIAVTDSGRSTGKIRIAVGVPAPGDIRNALVTLSEGDDLLKQLFQHRFQTEKAPDLDGMAFGNLFLAALTQMTGSFERAVQEASRILNLRGRVLPVTLYNTHLCAELEDGSIREGEVHVRGLHKPPIKRVFLKDHPIPTSQDCIDAIERADLVTIGPGSLFTTVIACLLAEGLSEAIHRSHALRVYICNTTTQPGQTDGFTVAMHVEQVLRYLGPGALDVVLINTGLPDEHVTQRYARDGVYPLQITDSDLQQIRHMGVTPVLANLIEKGTPDRVLWNKQDSILHDPETVARTLVAMVEHRRTTLPRVPGGGKERGQVAETWVRMREDIDGDPGTVEDQH